MCKKRRGGSNPLFRAKKNLETTVVSRFFRFPSTQNFVSEDRVEAETFVLFRNVLEQFCGNVKKCAVGKHPKSEKHGNTAQFSEVERSGTQENCGGIESGCLLRLHPLPVPRRRQPKRVACIDPDAVVVDKNIAKNDRFDLFSR